MTVALCSTKYQLIGFKPLAKLCRFDCKWAVGGARLSPLRVVPEFQRSEGVTFFSGAGSRDGVNTCANCFLPAWLLPGCCSSLVERPVPHLRGALADMDTAIRHLRGDTVPILVPPMRDGDGVDRVGAAGDTGAGDGAAGGGDGVGDTGGDAGSTPGVANHV
jgi:hypothetical protein